MPSNAKLVFKKYKYKKLCEMLDDIFKLTIRGKVISNEDPIELKKLFMKIPITKKGIKKFFKIMKRELSVQFMFHTEKVWKRFFMYLRNYYRNQYKKSENPNISKISSSFFKNIKKIEIESYQNCEDDYIYESEQYCPDACLNKTILCKTCGKERYMYTRHVDTSLTICNTCGKCILFFYEPCCHS